MATILVTKALAMMIPYPTITYPPMIVFMFQEKLAAWFVQSNISHTQGNAILKVLREHKCLAYLRIDIRTKRYKNFDRNPA